MASTVLPNGIIIPEKYSRDWYADLYHNWQELDNLLAGGVANDGTLTIQKNGSTVGTFSANQATDETINLAVPTKTSDLTNDSGFITEDTSKIPLTGTNALAGSIVPSTDNSYDFGSSTYKLRYVYCGTAYVNAINDIAPDELGLPSGTYTDVSSYITNFSNVPNSYIAPVSGFLFLEGNTTRAIDCAIFNITKGYNVNFPWGYYNTRGIVPVTKGDEINVYLKGPLDNFVAKIIHLKGKI